MMPAEHLIRTADRRDYVMAGLSLCQPRLGERLPQSRLQTLLLQGVAAALLRHTAGITVSGQEWVGEVKAEKEARRSGFLSLSRG